MAAIRMTERDPARRAEAAVRDVLPRSTKVRRGGVDADLIVNGIPLQLKWVGEGWLRDVRPLLASRRNRPDIVVARQISPGAREALAATGIGWVDETGAADVAVGSLVISRTGHPRKAPVHRKGWTPSVFAVAEVLLCGTRPTVAAVQEATGLSTGSSTHALRVLTELGLLVASSKRGRDSARRVADPGKLLDAYAAAASAMPEGASVQVGVTWRDPVVGLAQLGRQWDKAGLAWATSGAVAASVIAPYLTSLGSADVYVDAETVAGLEAFAVDAGLRPIEGGRLTLRPFPTVAVRRLAKKAKGLKLAPWPRVYSDLRTLGVRGEEAAEHLRESVHGG